VTTSSLITWQLFASSEPSEATKRLGCSKKPIGKESVPSKKTGIEKINFDLRIHSAREEVLRAIQKENSISWHLNEKFNKNEKKKTF